jgi:hypothetical protein
VVDLGAQCAGEFGIVFQADQTDRVTRRAQALGDPRIVRSRLGSFRQ